MNEAGYISSGHFPVDQYYHYGLALEFYTHFTASILVYSCLALALLTLFFSSLQFVDMPILLLIDNC